MFKMELTREQVEWIVKQEETLQLIEKLQEDIKNLKHWQDEQIEFNKQIFSELGYDITKNQFIDMDEFWGKLKSRVKPEA